METLSSALQYYVHLRVNNDPGWKGVEVINSQFFVSMIVSEVDAIMSGNCRSSFLMLLYLVRENTK